MTLLKPSEEDQVRTLARVRLDSLAAVCEPELGVTVDKSEQTSNWARRPLSREQLRYAAVDAEVLVSLWAKLGG